MTLSLPLSLLLTLGLACGDKDDDSGNSDGGASDGGASDGGASDGGASDGGASDGGASDGGASDGGSSDGGADDTARIRVFHASPDAPAVDIWVEGLTEPVITDLRFGQGTDFLEVPAGAYNFQVRAAPSEASDAVVYETGDLALPANAQVTALAAGLLRDDGDRAFRVVPLIEDWSSTGAGEILVRVVHASPDAPDVALDIGADGSPEVNGFGWLDDSEALVPGGVPFPAETSTRVAIWAGAPLSQVTAFTLPPLPEGTQVLAIAGGLLADPARLDTGFSLFALPPAGASLAIRQDPRVYALHGSPDAPAVDIFAGDSELVSNLAFGELAGPLQVSPGAYPLDFFAAQDGATRPDGDPAASALTPRLEAGASYLAMANGFLGDGSFELLAWEEGFALDDGTNVRARVIHASPDAPPVEVGPLSAGEVSSLGLLAYGEATAPEGISLAPASLAIGLALEGSTDPVVTFELDLRGAAGVRAFAIAAGSLGDSSAEAFRLLVVDTHSSPWTVSAVFPAL